ncbi:MAG: hypothetical protein KDK76_06210 [Chlamydiia bacterium]|nr:hypothetical protein [Chlamydiia bacterium]
MKIYLLCFIIAIQSLFAFCLKDKFAEGREGSYIVTEQNELISLLHLHTKKEGRLLFEEISIPSHIAKNTKWNEWINQGAPGHTSWILYEIDTEKGCVTECYSLTRQSWIPTEEMNAFFIPLISLELKFLPEEKRLQTGPSHKPGAVEARPWAPPQVFEGQKVKEAEYDVYTAKWPNDQTDLSGKPIVLYFDKQKSSFPFPYWLQVREGALKFKLRAIDGGQGLVSPRTDIPRRLPKFIGGVQKDGHQITLSLNCPTYYDHLKLYAIDMTENPRLTHSLSFNEKRKGENLILSIDQEVLKTLFTPGHEYLWILSSESAEVVAESPRRMTYYP